MTFGRTARAAGSLALAVLLLGQVSMGGARLAGADEPPPPPASGPDRCCPPAPPPPPMPVMVAPPAPAPLSDQAKAAYAPFYLAGLILRYGLYYLFIAPFEVFGRALSYGVNGGVETPAHYRMPPPPPPPPPPPAEGQPDPDWPRDTQPESR